jgi:glutamate-1-semialdehyde 2,1-aminomutase
LRKYEIVGDVIVDEKAFYFLTTKNTSKSKDVWKESLKYTPYGVHTNYRALDPYPMYFQSAHGSKIEDVDGNVFTDFNMAFGVLTTGHSHPELLKKIRDRIENGTVLGFEYADSYKLGKLITDRFKTEFVRFSTTGGEATTSATRFARAFTGREKIIKFEGCYHGSHDLLLVSTKPSRGKAGNPRFPNAVPSGTGIPNSALNDTIVLPFNDAEALGEAFRKEHDKIAGVILEPVPMNMGLVLPRKGFLTELRKLTEENNSVLIFDEVKTGSKHYGGAARYFNVKPDLITLGKAIGAGIPISAVTGKTEIMQTIGPGKTPHAGTFNSNPLSIDAGIAAMQHILTESNLDYAESLSKDLSKAYRDIIEGDKLPLGVQDWSVSGSLYFTTRKIENWRDFLTTNVNQWYRYYYMMLDKGIIPAAPGPDEQWTISVMHSKEDIDNHIEAFKQVSENLKHVISVLQIEEAL